MNQKKARKQPTAEQIAAGVDADGFQVEKHHSTNVEPLTVKVTFGAVEISPTFKTAPYRHMLLLAFPRERRWAMAADAEKDAERAVAENRMDEAEALHECVEFLRLGEWPKHEVSKGYLDAKGNLVGVGQYEGKGFYEMPVEWQEKALGHAKRAWKAIKSLNFGQRVGTPGPARRERLDRKLSALAEAVLRFVNSKAPEVLGKSRLYRTYELRDGSKVHLSSRNENDQRRLGRALTELVKRYPSLRSAQGYCGMT